MIALLWDILTIVLAVIGGLAVAALIVIGFGLFIIRGIRIPPLLSGDDESDPIHWT